MSGDSFVCRGPALTLYRLHAIVRQIYNTESFASSGKQPNVNTCQCIPGCLGAHCPVVANYVESFGAYEGRQYVTLSVLLLYVILPIISVCGTYASERGGDPCKACLGS